jgi:hypothetical protein
MISIKPLKKMHIAHFATIICFIIYIFSADLLFDRWLKVKGEAQSMNLDLPKESEKGKIRFGLDEIENTKIKWKKLGKIRGWTFIDGEDAKSTQIHIVFTSTNRTYSFDTQNFLRGDLPITFKRDDLHLEESGFVSNFPKDLMEDGIYELGVYLKNKRGTSFGQTGEYVSIINGKISRGFLSKVQIFEELPETHSVFSNIEVIKNVKSVDEDAIEIKGWAFVKDRNSQGNSIFVSLRSGENRYIFNTLPKKRPDVTTYFHTSQLNLDDSGFTARIPKRLVQNGEYEIGILIKNGSNKELKYSSKSIMF